MTVHEMLAPWRTSLDRSDEDTLRRLLEAVDLLVVAANEAVPRIPNWDLADQNARVDLKWAARRVRP